jgi:hypothetical protein
MRDIERFEHSRTMTGSDGLQTKTHLGFHFSLKNLLSGNRIFQADASGAGSRAFCRLLLDLVGEFAQLAWGISYRR